MAVFGNRSDIHANANAGIDVNISGKNDYVRSTNGLLESVLWAGVPYYGPTAHAAVFENIVSLVGDSGINRLRGDINAYAGAGSSARIFGNKVELSGFSGDHNFSYSVRVIKQCTIVERTCLCAGDK